MNELLNKIIDILQEIADRNVNYETRPVSDFNEQDKVRIINCKDGVIEILEGVIIDSYEEDDEGNPFARAITEGGRKFRGSVRNGGSRKGTRFDLI